MPINRFSVTADQVLQRIRLRLAADAGPAAAAVAWSDSRGTLVLNLSSLKFRAADGWLICNLDVHPPGEPVSTLQFVFCTARENEDAPLAVAGEIRAGDAKAAALADSWGAILQRAIWDGILDVIEGVLNDTGKQSPGRALTLMRFLTAEGTVHVDVQTADA
jgi:hypothetical protein